MDTFRTSSPAARDAAVERLRTLTVASAAAGVAAVVAFGTAAAISNPGHQATTSGTTATTSQQSESEGTTEGSGDDTRGTVSAPQTNTFFQAPAQQPGFFAGGAQTVTGGS